MSQNGCINFRPSKKTYFEFAFAGYFGQSSIIFIFDLLLNSPQIIVNGRVDNHIDDNNFINYHQQLSQLLPNWVNIFYLKIINNFIEKT